MNLGGAGESRHHRRRMLPQKRVLSRGPAFPRPEQVDEPGGLLVGVLAPHRFDAKLTTQCDRVHRFLAYGGDPHPGHQDRRHRVWLRRDVEDGEGDVTHARSTTRLRLSSISKNSSM